MTANILHPSRYHGFNSSPPYFEGWYFKLVSKDHDHKVAVIPGVFISKEKNKSHSFIQFFDSQDNKVNYHRFPFDAFNADKDQFRIEIGHNNFTSQKISLDIDDNLGKVQGELKFNQLNPWPVNFFSPGAMGWFAWVPFMECYHGVVSMDHGILGELKTTSKVLDFSEGRGYIEKDWGKQFPSAWIWGQSNHFDKPGVSIMISVAIIPWLGSSFNGFVIGVLLDGKLHRFATYNRSKIEQINLDDREVHLMLRNQDTHLNIRALRVEGGLLQAPTKIEMGRRIMETLDAEIEIRLEDLKGGIIYEGIGKNAGLEMVGDLDQLIKMVD